MLLNVSSDALTLLWPYAIMVLCVKAMYLSRVRLRYMLCDRKQLIRCAGLVKLLLCAQSPGVFNIAAHQIRP